MSIIEAGHVRLIDQSSLELIHSDIQTHGQKQQMR
jgi:hypothetical protein